MVTFLASAILAATPAQIEIDSVKRLTVTLGRRGQRVEESWSIRVSGKSATIVFDAYHTRTAGTPKFHQAGDRVELDLSNAQKEALTDGGTIHLSISAVRD